jgi:hypothetical protein
MVPWKYGYLIVLNTAREKHVRAELARKASALAGVAAGER